MASTKAAGVLLFLYYCWDSTYSSNPDILESPKSKNITLGEPVTLICIATGITIKWRTNPSINITQMKKDMTVLNVTNHTSTLKGTVELVGSSYTNNITVWCIAVGSKSSGTSTDKSEKAHIFVQGLLESVSNLTVTPFNSTTVLISWSPPFTLEGVPILGYNVTITNTTSAENETMLVEDTTLLYSIDHPDPEYNFTVTVVPINEVGAGQPAKCVMIPVQPDIEPPTRSSRPFVDTHTVTSTSLVLPTSFVVSSKKLAPTSHTPEPPQPVTAAVVSSVVLVVLTLMIGLLTLMVVYFVIHRKQKRSSRITLSAPKSEDEQETSKPSDPSLTSVETRLTLSQISTAVETTPEPEVRIQETSAQYQQSDSQSDTAVETTPVPEDRIQVETSAQYQQSDSHHFPVSKEHHTSPDQGNKATQLQESTMFRIKPTYRRLLSLQPKAKKGYMQLNTEEDSPELSCPPTAETEGNKIDGTTTSVQHGTGANTPVQSSEVASDILHVECSLPVQVTSESYKKAAAVTIDSIRHQK